MLNITKVRCAIYTLVVFSLVLFFQACQQSYEQPSEFASQKYPLMKGNQIKNVILFVGDGMGLVHVAGARLKYLTANGRLHMEKMPVTGFLDTHAANKLVTDSSAAITAMATGYKTNTGMISVTPDGKKVLSIMEACRDRGMGTGIIATCDVTQSTPAAFAVHVKSRWDATHIAEQYVNSGMNIILGGGKRYFMPQSNPDSSRKDDKDLVNEMKSRGYVFVENKAQFETVSGEYILGLFKEDALKFDADEPSLAEMTKKTIEILNKNPKGFFMMVEGSQIDSYSHRRDIEKTLERVKRFDDAVLEAINFALEDKSTLVLVTADHEAGGLAIDGGSLDGKELDIKWISRFHTFVPTPLYALGPDADLFMGLQDNTELSKKIAYLLKINHFPASLE